MPRPLKIGIVGCGAIGSSLARAIKREFSGLAALVAVYDIEREKALNLSFKIERNNSLAASSLECLIRKSELVIEASSARASFDIARKSLSRGRDIMIMSVGGVVADFKRLCSLARSRRARIYIPSGAVSGIDALKASRLGKIKSVTLTTIKNPASFQGVSYIRERGIDLEKIRQERVIFRGNARDAIRHFPQNINVAGLLSLSGIGLKKTKVCIIASSRARRNIHEIRVVSDAGSIFTRTENLIHPDNPKTSFLAYLSAVANLKQILEPMKIGT